MSSSLKSAKLRLYIQPVHGRCPGIGPSQVALQVWPCCCSRQELVPKITTLLNEIQNHTATETRICALPVVIKLNKAATIQHE